MVRIVRNITELSKRKQVAVGIVNCFISIGIIFLVDHSMGVRWQTSVFNIVITLIVGAGFLYTYGIIAKAYERRKARLSNGP